MVKRRRTKKTASTEDLNKRFNNGFISYCRRLWPFDFGLLKSLQIVGFRTESKELSDELSKETVQEFSGSIDPRLSTYNKLARKLNNNAKEVTTLRSRPWEDDEDDILEYFATGLSIYEDSDDYGRQKGYYYNHNTGVLRFYEDGKFNEVCRFDVAGKEAMDGLFPELIPSKAWLYKSQKNVKLTSEKFMNLVRVSQAGGRQPTFHLPITNSFLKVFDKISRYMQLSKLLDKQKESIPEQQLVDEVVADLKARVKEYTSGNNSSAHSPEKIEIMKAVGKYLDTGDYAELTKKIEQYDKSWVKWSPFPSEAYRILSYIGKIRKDTLFDRMVKARVERNELSESRKTSGAQDLLELAYEPLLEVSDAKLKASEFWNKQEVDHASYLQMLQNLDSKLEELLVIYPENEVIDNTSDMNPSSFPSSASSESNFESNISEFVDEGIAIRGPKPVISMLRQEIQIRVQRANNPDIVDVHESCQSKCASLTHLLLDVVGNRYLDEVGNELIDQSSQAKFNEVGDELFQVLSASQMQAKSGPYQRVDPVEVLARVTKLSQEASNINIKLLEISRELTRLQQSPFVTDIQNFMTDVVGPRIEELAVFETTLTEIKKLRVKPFNLLAPSNDAEEEVARIVNELNDYASALTDGLESKLTRMKDPLDPSTEIDRVPHIPYRDNKEYRNKPNIKKKIEEIETGFVAVVDTINQYLDEIQEGVEEAQKQQSAEVSVSTRRSPSFFHRGDVVSDNKSVVVEDLSLTDGESDGEELDQEGTIHSTKKRR